MLSLSPKSSTVCNSLKPETFRCTVETAKEQTSAPGCFPAPNGWWSWQTPSKRQDVSGVYNPRPLSYTQTLNRKAGGSGTQVYWFVFRSAAVAQVKTTCTYCSRPLNCSLNKDERVLHVYILYICISVYIVVYLSIYPPNYLTIYLSIYPLI